MQPTYDRSAVNARAQSAVPFVTPLEIRCLDGTLDSALKAWIRERLARHLAKFAPQIERIDVRFSDVNGPKGGIGRCCLVHMVLSTLPPVVAEVRAATDREAFDLAAGRAARAFKDTVQKHGFTTKHKRRQRGIHGEALEVELEAPTPGGEKAKATVPSRRLAQLPHAHTRLARVPSAEPAADGAQAPRAADLLDADHHTALRNTKASAASGYALEDSTTGKPSRRSTRRGANHIKPANPLTVRTKSAVHRPQQVAARRG